jgi:hypothetical protein
MYEVTFTKVFHTNAQTLSLSTTVHGMIAVRDSVGFHSFLLFAQGGGGCLQKKK